MNSREVSPPPSRRLLTATRTVECTCSLAGRDDYARNRLAVARPSLTARGHTAPATDHMTVVGLVTSLPFLLTAHGHKRVVGGQDGVTGIARRLLLLPAITATLGYGWLHPSFPDLVRLFLSLSGPVAQRDAAIGSMLLAAGVTGAGVLPGPATPVTSATPVACSSASVSTPEWCSLCDSFARSM